MRMTRGNGEIKGGKKEKEERTQGQRQIKGRGTRKCNKDGEEMRSRKLG